MNDHNGSRDGARILLVDDDWRLLKALDMKLTSMGFRCIACNNASEAVSTFLVEMIDLVITDLAMPNIDGLGIIGLIRHQSNVPIIVVTGQRSGDVEMLKGYHDILILRKPCEFEKLLEGIRTFLPCIAGITPR